MVAPSSIDGVFPAADAMPAEAAAERTARHQRMLAELAEIGMALAREVKRRVEAGETEDGADPGLTFSRVAKAVRMTLALEERLADMGKDRARDARLERFLAERERKALRGARRMDRVRDMVEAAIEARAADEEGETADAGQLERDLSERLDEEETAPEFDWEGDQPLAEIAAAICEDLGVRCDPAAWAGIGTPEAETPPTPAERPKPPPRPRATGAKAKTREKPARTAEPAPQPSG